MPEALLKEIVPEEFRSAGYLKDLLDKEQTVALPEVFKKLHNAETLVGKKTGVPAADAPDADWDKFLDGLKPAKAEDYKFPGQEDGKGVDPNFVKIVQEAFLEGRVNTRQAAKFLAKYQAGMKDYAEKMTAKQKAEQEKADKAFDELAKSALGEQNKAKLAQAKKLIDENCPATLKPFVGKLDDKSLVILAGVINGIAEKYMAEDELNPNGKTGGDGGKGKREEAKALLNDIMKMSGFEHDYDAKRAKLKQLYKEADAEAKAGK